MLLWWTSWAILVLCFSFAVSLHSNLVQILLSPFRHKIKVSIPFWGCINLKSVFRTYHLEQVQEQPFTVHTSCQQLLTWPPHPKFLLGYKSSLLKITSIDFFLWQICMCLKFISMIVALHSLISLSLLLPLPSSWYICFNSTCILF